MKNGFGVALISSALLLSACNGSDSKESSAASPAASSDAQDSSIAAPASGDWIEVTVATADGGFRMGNPNAKVKLVEYASLTCPHCRDFSTAATAPLRENYVKAGKVSWEFRNFVLNSVDMSASLLLRCNGAGPFFKLLEQVYEEQTNWTAKFSKITPEQEKAISALPQEKQFEAIAKAGELDQFFKVRGLPAEKATQCLNDPAGLEQLSAIRKLGTERDGVEGTPSFTINGTKVEASPTWIAMETEIKKALGE